MWGALTWRKKIVDFPLSYPPPPLLPPQTLGMGSIGQNSTFSPEQHQHKPTKTFVPGQHARIQDFFVGGGGELGAPQLILQFTEGVNGFITHFPGGSNFSQGGGVQMLISIETHKTITCDFPGGGGGPGSPLWIPHIDNVAFWHE